MCAQPSLPVVPDNSSSASSRGGDGDSGRNEVGAKKPGVALSGAKKPPLVFAGPRPPVNKVRLQPPKKPDQKVCSSSQHFLLP